MKRSLIITVLCVVFAAPVFAQKKVAIVSFYINRQINVDDFGAAAHFAAIKLGDDSAFNLAPLLRDFHRRFFEDYFNEFPFQLFPESYVTGNADYKNYVMATGEGGGLANVHHYETPYDGYKIAVPFLTHPNEKALLKVFPQADGVMVVNVEFKLVQLGLGGMGIVRVKAIANMVLINKNGDVVFWVEEDAKSKGVTPMVAGAPVMTPDKILPLCESALNQLMDELPKALPKIVKKSDAKL